MSSAREQAREAARNLHRRSEGRALPNAYAEVVSDVWKPYIQRILNVVNNDGIGYVKTIGMIVDICDEALDG